MTKMISVARQCPFCGKKYAVEVPEKGFLDWFEGRMVIQRAMPQISAEIRESLLTGMCAECQKDVFGD